MIFHRFPACSVLEPVFQRVQYWNLFVRCWLYCRLGLGGTGRLYSTSELTRLSSRSPEWKMITEKEREKLGLVTEDDGEFWYVY